MSGDIMKSTCSIFLIATIICTNTCRVQSADESGIWPQDLGHQLRLRSGKWSRKLYQIWLLGHQLRLRSGKWCQKFYQILLLNELHWGPSLKDIRFFLSFYHLPAHIYFLLLLWVIQHRNIRYLKTYPSTQITDIPNGWPIWKKAFPWNIFKILILLSCRHFYDLNLNLCFLNFSARTKCFAPRAKRNAQENLPSGYNFT